MTRTPPLPLLLAALVCAGARAQTAATPANEAARRRAAATAGSLVLDDLVITATSHETDLRRTPYELLRLDMDDLQLRLQPRSITEALAEVPGVQLQKTGHGMTSPHLRGLTGQRVLLLVDGVRLNNATLREGPNQYWNLVDSFFFDDLEVLMGPAGVLYGSDAVGGVVQARSWLPERGLADDGLQWQGGKLLLRSSSAEHSLSEHLKGAMTLADRWGAAFGLTRQNFGELVTGGHEHNQNTDYHQWSGTARAVRWFDDDHRLVLGAEFFDQDDVERVHRTIHHVDFHGTSTKGKTGDLGRTYDHDRSLVFARFEKRRGQGLLEELDLQLSWQYLGEDYRRLRSDGRRQLRHTATDTFGLVLRAQTSNRLGKWNLGADWYRDVVTSVGVDVSAAGVPTGRIQGQVADDATYDLFGVYLQNELPVGARVEIISGVRYTYARMDAGHVNISSADLPLDGSWNDAVGSVRLLYRLRDEDQLNLFAGVSQGFRAPNLSDATRDDEWGGGVEAPTTDLDAEHFTTYEAGLKANGQRGYANLTAYYTRMKDRIFRLKTPTTKRNLDDGYIQGVEANAGWRLTDAVLLFASGQWQEGREETFADRDLSQPIVTRPTSRVLPLSGTVGVRCEPANRPFWLETLIDAAHGQDQLSDGETGDNRYPPAGTPSYAVWTIRGGWRLSERSDLAVALENVTDERYRIHGSGVNEPGRNLVVSLACRF